MPQCISHDRLFKQLISTFFEDFMTLFFPEAARHIDFSHLAFLRQELLTDVARGDVRYVDLFAETKLKGEDGVIVVHVETQASRQRDFHEWMFLYFARLYEKLRKRIVPVAVFAYRRGEDEPDGFEMKVPFLEVLTFRFYALELGKLNWRAYAELENPVAAAMLAKMGYGEEEEWNAGRYDRHHGFVSKYGKSLLPLLALKPGEYILDLGCGTGDLTEEIHRSGAEVVGVDRSEAMILKARRKFPSIVFVCADAVTFENE